jgi:hypothetical protein
MAKLKAFVAKLEDVAEKFRELYVEDAEAEEGRRFRLDADGVEDVTGLKNTVTALRTENRNLKIRVKPLDELEADDDVEAIVTAGKETLEARKSGKAAPEVESVRNQLVTQHGKELKKLQTVIDGQTETLREVLIEQEARAVLGDKDVRGNPALLLPAIREQATVVEYEDAGKKKFRASVLGEDKHERLDSKGKPLTIKALVAEMREKPEYSDAFEGTGASGSGTPTEGGSGTPTPPRTPTAPADERKTAKRRTGDYSQI